jgi:hypothetical protein
MKAAIKQFIAKSLRYVARLVLGRPWLKRRVRDLVIRMPRLHAVIIRTMSQAPSTVQYKVAVDQESLSPNAQRMHRALKQAIRTRRN